MVLSERRQRNGGGRGGGEDFQLCLQDKLSLDLKQSSDSAVTTSWGSSFQSGMVLGKDDICLCCVLQDFDLRYLKNMYLVFL